MSSAIGYIILGLIVWWLAITICTLSDWLKERQHPPVELPITDAHERTRETRSEPVGGWNRLVRIAYLPVGLVITLAVLVLFLPLLVATLFHPRSAVTGVRPEPNQS